MCTDNHHHLTPPKCPDKPKLLSAKGKKNMSENEAKIFEKGAKEFQAAGRAVLFLAKTNLGFSLQKHRFLLPSTLKT